MKIAVYSGSFNPLHIGHQAIMEQVTGDGLFDCIYLIVSPQSPFKDSSMLDNALSRLEAAAKALSRHPSIKARVEDIEMRMEAPHYTIRTLDALREREPGNDFTLVMGADCLESFRRWKDYSRILLEYGVAVFPRPGFDLEALRLDLLSENPGYRISLLDMTMVDVSSTMIREGLRKGEDVSSLLM